MTVPPGAPATVPYFLERPLQADLYDWSAAAPGVRGDPFQPAPVRAVAHVTIAGESVVLQRDVSFRVRDQELGEVRRPVRAAPAVEVSVEPDLLVWPLGQSSKRLEVALLSHAATPVSGRLEVLPPAGWPAPAPRPFTLAKAGERLFFDVELQAPPALAAGRHEVRFAARIDGGAGADLGIRLIDYGYIPRTPMPERAEAKISAADIRFPPLRRLGYVRGAADRVPEALTALGVPVEILTARDLDAGDLSHYDAILVGSRAYETDPALPRANGRLLDYARAGGLVVVQYQQYPFVQGGYAPFALEIARPHDRVTDETARGHRSRPREPDLHDAQPHRARRLGRMGPGARPLLRAHLGAGVHAAPRDGRSGRPRAEGRPARREARARPLRLHGARVLPTAPRRRARGVSAARQPARVEVLSRRRPK